MRLAVLAAVVLVAVPAIARADEPVWSGPPGAAPYAPAYAPYYAPPPKVTREVSYAHQTLASDGIAAVLVTSALLQDNEFSAMGLVMLGAMTYSYGAPIVHFANRKYLNGLTSFGLRMALPMLGAALGNSVGPKDRLVCDQAGGCPPSDESTIGLLLGAGLGAVAAVAIDAKYIARKRVEVAPTFVPTVNYGSAGWSFGVGGSF